MIIQLHLFICSDIIFNTNMIYIATVCLCSTVDLLKMIYICGSWEDILHSMLVNPDYKNILIENYKQETFLTFMLTLHLYVTRS